jgi:tRNA pseudouridine55 synthase
MDVVRRVKRASREKRVGHGGTLDPVATGVIAICIGEATRMMEFLIEGTKEYRGLVRLGVETDTYDSMGQVTGRIDPSFVTLQDVEGALESLEGSIEQVPPMYSALKRQGKRLYDLARAGIDVEREPRKVQVHSIDLLDWSSPLVTLNVTCGRGFYMRSLAHDLGHALGTGGHLENLVRLRSGPFKISEAIAITDLEQKCADGTWRESLYAPDVVVGYMRSAIVGRQVEELIRHGTALPHGLGIPFSRPDEQCRVFSTDGRFVAVLSFNASKGQWQPARVYA